MFTMTDAAKAQLKKNLGETDAEAIRIALKKSGCSGYMYYIDLCQKVDDSVVTLDTEPVLVVTEEETLPFLENVQLDYIQDGINRMFKFSNPAAKGECGCGESFML